MTKADIVDNIADAIGLTKIETEAVIDGFFQSVIELLASGDHLEIRGFGSFRVKNRKSHVARNPRSGEIVQVPEHFIPFFRPSNEVRVFIDGQLKKKDGKMLPDKKNDKTTSKTANGKKKRVRLKKYAE